MRHLRANSFMADRGARLGGTYACPPPPPGGQVRTAPVVTPPATGAGNSSTQGSAVMEARAAHNREVTGSTPVPATRSDRQTRPGRSAPAVRASEESTAVIPQAVTAAETAPAATPCPAGAVILSSHAMILLRRVAAYERLDNSQAVTLALANYMRKIGAGPLARAVLDEIERNGAPDHNRSECIDGGEGNAALPAGCDAGDDLFAVPEFRRVGESRFRGGGP